MIETLRIYIEQRFSALKFLGLALFLFFYTVPFHAVNLLSLLQVIKLLFILFALRLYDDVMQWENDSEFSERIYTNEKSRSKLILPLILSLALSVLICATDGHDFTIALLWLCFLLLNHILYKALVHLSFWSFILPLLKYPVLYFYLSLCYYTTDDFTVSDLLNQYALLLSFVVYDLIDVGEKRKIPFFIYFLVALSIALMLIPNLTLVSLISAVIVLILSVILILVNYKRSILPLAWLFLILIFKLIANNYVI